jgi:hypothetical protein
MAKYTIIHISGQPGSGKTTLSNYVKDLNYKHVLTYDLDSITIPIIHDSKISTKDSSLIKEFNKKYEHIVSNALNKKVKIIILVGIVNCFTTKSKQLLDFNLEDTKYPPSEKYFINSNFGTLINQIKKRMCDDDIKLEKNSYLLKYYYRMVGEHKSQVRNTVVGGAVTFDKDYLFIKTVKDETHIDNKYYIVDRKYVPKTQHELIILLTKKISDSSKEFIMPEVLEIIIPYSLESINVLITFLTEQYPLYNIIDAYDSLYNISGQLDYTRIPNKTIILSRPLLVIHDIKSNIHSIDIKQSNLPKSYLKVTIECCTKIPYNNFCKTTNNDKIFFDETLTTVVDFNDSIDLLSSKFVKNSNPSYTFHNVAKFVEGVILSI